MKKDKKIFIIRLIFFILIGVGVPISYMIYRFDMFKTATKIGIAELLCTIILISIVVVLMKYYLDGMKTKYSLAKQIIAGFCKVIVPLVLSFLIILWLENNIGILQEFLFVTIPCEIVAICINPLPKWAFENNVDGLGAIVNKIFDKNKEGK